MRFYTFNSFLKMKKYLFPILENENKINFIILKNEFPINKKIKAEISAFIMGKYPINIDCCKAVSLTNQGNI